MKNLLRRSILKKSPFGLLKSMEHQLKAKKEKTPPAWYEAMKLVPMAPLPSPYDDYSQSGSFNATNSSVEESQRYFATNQTRRIQRRNNIAVMPIKHPREIEFPEDRLRSKFYSSHPFELHRPRSIIDNENSLLYRDWSSIHGGNIPTPVTGESVIQYSLYLMSEKGGSKSEDEAYELALKDFYQERLTQERKEKDEKSFKTKNSVSSESIEDALIQLEIIDSRKANPISENILEIEGREIEEGQAFSQMQQEA